MTYPEIRPDSFADDKNSIIVDVSQLYSQFITPIDSKRSFAMPDILATPSSTEDSENVVRALGNATFDASEVQESRAHAYYRMLGMPVIGTGDVFYNPGFDPTLNRDQRNKNSNIKSKVPLIVRQMTKGREDGVKFRERKFSVGSVDGSVYGTVMGAVTFPFMVMDPAIGVIERDLQQFSIPERKIYISTNYKKNSDGYDITTFFDIGTHPLKPFTVDPNIDDVVQDLRRIIASPFLSDSNRIIDRGISAPRPGIEFVMRRRFRAAKFELTNALSVDDVFQDISIAGFAEVASYILNSQQVTDENVQELVKRLGSVELYQIDKYIKTINGLLDKLIQAYNAVSNLSVKIKWTPMPNRKGPEYGSIIASWIAPKNLRSELEIRIRTLTVISEIAKRQAQLSDDDSIKPGDFAISLFENVERTYDQEIEDANGENAQLANVGIDALKIIEIIKGEISGIGLVDIIAIYTALWAVENDVLISLLDDRSFNRLYNIVELRIPEVESRKVNGKAKYTITEAMGQFEQQVQNILSFADKRYQQLLASPTEAEGGSPAS